METKSLSDLHSSHCNLSVQLRPYFLWNRGSRFWVLVKGRAAAIWANGTSSLLASEPEVLTGSAVSPHPTLQMLPVGSHHDPC